MGFCVAMWGRVGELGWSCRVEWKISLDVSEEWTGRAVTVSRIYAFALNKIGALESSVEKVRICLVWQEQQPLSLRMKAETKRLGRKLCDPPNVGLAHTKCVAEEAEGSCVGSLNKGTMSPVPWQAGAWFLSSELSLVTTSLCWFICNLLTVLPSESFIPLDRIS